MWRWLQSKWQSLIFRLLLYFSISMLALALILAASFTKRLKPHLQHDILPNLERYIEYIIDDIGIPPDLSTAQQLADELPFELRIEGPDVDWTSSMQLRSLASYEFEPAPLPYDNVFFSHHRHRQFLLIKQSGYQYLFAVDNSFRQGAQRRHWTLFVLLGLVFGLLYYAIRRMLRPIQTISQRVEQIGAGDLEQSLHIPGRSELSLLATGINDMSGQIRSMLESKSSLLLAISHELRSPITRMRVNLELLDHSDNRQKLIDDLAEMKALVAAILESERLNSGHAPLNLEHCDLSALVEEVISGHACHNRIQSSLSPVSLKLDRLRIKLMLKNLIDNACHYSAADDGPIEVNLTKYESNLCLEVRDYGSGIAAQDIPRLTEAFYRSDSARRRATGGYGLGLYLCRLIVDAHEGRMTIQSELGSGSRVSVELPLGNS